MRRLSWSVAGNAFFVPILAFALGLALSSGRLRAAEGQKNLQLEVIINGAPANMIGSFVLFPDNRIGATPNELREIGLRTNARFAQDIVLLDDIPRLKYEYDERAQRIRFTVDDADRQGRAFDLGGNGRNFARAQAGWGAVLNYDLLSTTSSLRDLRLSSFSGSSLTVEGRAFSPYGTFEQSGIWRAAIDQSSTFIRLDTSLRYSDQDRMITYRAGDAINGGLAWSRPVRLGGLQAQSNFALRPDLITMPLPVLGGVAAVPSAVDLYVNNIKTFSQDIGPGPFSLSNIPIVSGAGNAQLVLRDSSGHETRTTVPFYASPILLAPGLSAWSIEGGLPRLSFGSSSDSYAQSPIGSATLRRGVFDWLTLEGHVEAGAGVTNGGLGAAFLTGSFGVASASVSGSTGFSGNGVQAYLSYETRLFGMSLSVSSQRAFGAYDDLASATARLQDLSFVSAQRLTDVFGLPPGALGNLALPVTNSAITPIYTTARAPRAFDRITVTAPFPFDISSSISASFLHLIDAAGTRSDILTASYTRPLPYNASFYATAFRDFGTHRSTGMLVGLSVPLSDSISASSGASIGQGAARYTTDITKPLGPTPGSYGWRVRDSEGGSGYREASAAYRSNYGAIQVGAAEDRNGSRGLVELRGSIATMGGGVFLSNWIDDGFAVIRTGAAGVEVSHDNRPAGLTDARGMLLVPTLRSYQKNKITVDPSNLPIDSEIETTREVVAPADRAGVLVDFKVRNDTASALVVFTRPGGESVPPGAIGRLGNGVEFVVGYDGEAFIRDLAAANTVTIELVKGTCQAEFQFAPRPGEQVRISPVECR